MLGELIEAEGGTVVKDVTSGLDYLIVGIGESRGTGPSGAEKKAASFNKKGKLEIQILEEAGFKQLFARDRDAAITLLQSGKSGVARWNDTVAMHWLGLSIDVRNSIQQPSMPGWRQASCRDRRSTRT